MFKQYLLSRVVKTAVRCGFTYGYINPISNECVFYGYGGQYITIMDVEKNSLLFKELMVLNSLLKDSDIINNKIEKFMIKNNFETCSSTEEGDIIFKYNGVWFFVDSVINDNDPLKGLWLGLNFFLKEYVKK